MKGISVIIVSWNGCALLRQCLHSIREAGGSLVREIILVDNASSDGSADMVEEEFPEVTLIRAQENLGFARGNNLGLQRATGSWLALINSDVVVHPGCFERLAACLEEHAEVGLVGPKVFGRDGRPQPTCRRLPSMGNVLCRSLALDELISRWRVRCTWARRHPEPDLQREPEVLSGCFWVARREAVEQVGSLDERFFFYAEDTDWCKRFRDRGWKVVFVPAATATHFGGGSSANAPLRYSIEILRANLAYWKKHHGRLGQAFCYSASVLHHTLRLMARALRGLFHHDASGENAYKRLRSLTCLRWLLTGKEIPSGRSAAKTGCWSA